MRDDYWTLSFPRLTQDASGDFYPDSPKEATMTTDQPAWATDPRGLPPYVADCDGLVWGLESGLYGSRTPAEIEAKYGPVTPLWPDTPPTSPLPDLSRWHPVPAEADIPPNTMYAFIHKDGGWGRGSSGSSGYVAADRSPHLTYYTEHPIPTPDPDAHWIRAIAEATPETAATVYAAIKGEQA